MGVNYQMFIPDVQKASQESGVPASVTLAQIILESGGRYENGLSGLAHNYKNLFGVKGSGTGGSVSLPTKEVRGGVYTTENAKFRVYNSYLDSIKDHNRLLTTDRYTAQTKNAKTVEDYVAGIHKAGYATDPQYTNKLLNIIKKNNLTQYDTGPIKYSGKGPTHEIAEGAPATGSTTTTGSTTEKDDRNSFTENLFFNTVRVVSVIGLLIVMFIFFMKAFPAVQDVTSAVPVGRAVNAMKKVKKKGS